MREKTFHRPWGAQSALQWDRKAWSHLQSFTELDVALDPGNVVLACCTQALICRAASASALLDERVEAAVEQWTRCKPHPAQKHKHVVRSD